MGSRGQAVQPPAPSLRGQKDTPPGAPLAIRARVLAVLRVSVPCLLHGIEAEWRL